MNICVYILVCCDAIFTMYGVFFSGFKTKWMLFHTYWRWQKIKTMRWTVYFYSTTDVFFSDDFCCHRCCLFKFIFVIAHIIFICIIMHSHFFCYKLSHTQNHFSFHTATFTIKCNCSCKLNKCTLTKNSERTNEWTYLRLYIVLLYFFQMKILWLGF